MAYIPYHFKAQEICNGVMRNSPWALRFIPDHLQTQEMCNEAVEAWPWTLEYVPDNLKTQEMCNEAVRWGPWNLRYASDWFVTQQQIKIWHDDAYYCNDDRLIRWYKGHLKRKAQKTKIKEELFPIAWHPPRYWDWSMSEEEKEETEKLWAQKWTFLYLITTYKSFFERSIKNWASPDP